MQTKRKSLLYFLILFLILPCLFVFSACGESGGENNEPQISYISVSYAGNTYDFDATQSQPSIPYQDNLNFAANDFVVVIHYVDGSDETQISASEANFVINKITYSQNGEMQKTLATEFSVGEYEIAVNYNEFSATLPFSITAIDISQNDDIVAIYQEQQTYKPSEQNFSIGDEICPVVTIRDGNQVLVEDTDYTISYINNSDISTVNNKASIVVTGMGKYSGQKTFEFTINKLVLQQVQPVQANLVSTYIPGTDQIGLITSNMLNLPEGIFGVKYKITKNNVVVYDDSINEPIFGEIINAGVYQIEYFLQIDEAHFVYNHDNPTATLTINTIDILNYLVNNEITRDYIDTAFTADLFTYELINLRATENDNYLSDVYAIEMLQNGTDLGNNVVVDNQNVSNATRTGAFKIIASGNYTGEIIVRFTIAPLVITYAYFENLSNLNYTGAEQKPEPIVTAYSAFASQSLILVKDIDYTLSYPSDCVNAGVKTITIVGQGNFSGQTSIDYTISQAEIILSGYNFAHPSTIYNGQDQKDYLLALNEELPEQVEVVFTKNGFLDAQLAEEVTMLKNANTLYSTPGEYIYANFKIKSQYANNYVLNNSQVDFYNIVAIEPYVVGQSTEVYTAQTITGFEGTHEVYGQNVYYYTYSGTAYAPKVVINVDLNGEVGDGAEYTLVEGQDYVLQYCTYDGYNIVTPLNAGEYYVTVRYEIAAWNQNFATYKAQNGANMDYGSSNSYLRFDIEKAQLDDSQIAWPQTYRMIWNSKAYLNSACTILSQDSSISIANNDVNVNFQLNEYNSGYGYGAWLDSNGQVEIIFDSENYSAQNHLSTPSIVNPFTLVKLNNQVLTTQQFDSDELQLKLGDKLELSFGEDYEIYYGNSDSNFNAIIFDSNAGFSRIIGIDTLNGEYVHENSFFISVRSISGDSYVTAKTFNINRSLFSELASYTSTDTLDINYLNQFSWQVEEWCVHSGGKFKMTLAQDFVDAGYTFDYDLVAPDSVATTYSTKLTTKTWVNDNSFARVVIRIYNAQNDLVYTLHYNFEVTSALNLSMNPSIEFVFSQDGYLISFTALNDEANYVLSDGEIGFLTGSAYGDSKQGVIYKYIALMEKYGYLGAQNAALTISTTNSSEITTLEAMANYEFDQRNVDIEVNSQVIAQSTVLNTIKDYYREYSTAELEGMTEAQLLDLLKDLRTQSSSIQSNDLKELYYLQRAIFKLYHKVDYILTLAGSNSAIADSQSALVSVKNALYTEDSGLLRSISDIYVNSLLKTSSAVVVAKASLAEMKKMQLNALANGNNEYAAQLGERLQQLESSLNYSYSLIMNSINSLKTNLRAVYSDLDTMLISFGISQSDIDAMYAYIDAQDFDQWFNDNHYNTYNLNIWTGTGIVAYGTPQYVYQDTYLTYSFNIDADTHQNVVYIYNGQVSDFDNATPNAFFGWYDMGTMIMIDNSEYETFMVDGTDLMKAVQATGTLVYTFIMETGGMQCKIEFFDGGELNYYIDDTFVISGTWTEENNVVTADIHGSIQQFNVVNGELVVIQPEPEP